MTATREETERAEGAGDAELRRIGRTFVAALYASLKALRLYPAENVAVQRAIADVIDEAELVLQREEEIELRASSEFLFLNGSRLRLELESYASFAFLLAHMRAIGMTGLRVRHGATTRDWTVLLSQLNSVRAGGEGDLTAVLTGRIRDAGVTSFDVLDASDVLSRDSDEGSLAREAATRTYAQSVTVTREVMTSVRLGESPNVKRIKRAVQGIVDQIISDEQSLLGLTTLRDYDEYTFTHSVNVCIFSLALGRRLGFTRAQLYELGLAGLFHDLGKSRVPLSVLNKSSGITPEDWRELEKHPWLGVLAMCEMSAQQELPYRAMIVAYEHHMKIDLSGYPKAARPRRLSILSKIVAVADGVDAATSSRVYQRAPMTPPDVLRGMREKPQFGFDPVIVKAFLNLTGAYPVGTLVMLDTSELALVHSSSPDPRALSRPVVRIVSDARGNVEFPGRLVDLNLETESGAYERTIVDTADPERYAIRVSDYFV